jgi:hypothetical protein
LEACSRLTYEPRTICIVSDEPVALPDDRHFVNIITGAAHVTSPATKRDLARTSCPDAEVYAYLDDDAFPPPDWLDEAIRVLAEHPQAAGAGGPGLMPDDQMYWERVSSATLGMRGGSGPLRFRFVREPARDCDDFPAYNLIVRKEWLDAVGGWATDWYGGEDTTLCARLADKGGLIRYDPSVYIYHYRRSLLPHHAWQIYNVGRSRGCFIRGGDTRSRRLLFAAPLAVTLATAGLALSPLFGAPLGFVAAAAASAYAGCTLAAGQATSEWRVRLMAPLGLIVHHAVYAYGMCVGLLTGRRTARAWQPVTRSDPLSTEPYPTPNSE